MTPFNLSHMAINAASLLIYNSLQSWSEQMMMILILILNFTAVNSTTKDIEVKHTYFLIVPTDKDNTSIDINYNPNVQPINEAVKRWTQQPWFHRSEIEKFHLIQPKRSLPVSGKHPFKRLWTEWATKGWKHPLSTIHVPSSWRGVTEEKTVKE